MRILVSSALLTLACATQAVAQDNACEIARQVIVADNDAYARVFNEGKGKYSGQTAKDRVCEAGLAQNLDEDIAALKKEMEDANTLKLACPGVERAQTGADKLIMLLQPKLESAKAAKDAVDKECAKK